MAQDGPLAPMSAAGPGYSSGTAVQARDCANGEAALKHCCHAGGITKYGGRRLQSQKFSGICK